MKKAFDIIRTILVWTVVLFAISMFVFTIFSVTTINRNDRTLFGYKMFIVTTDSMQATDFSSGDLIFIKPVDPDTLQAGDIITFTAKNRQEETMTHKIRVRATDLRGNPGFVTYGTTTNTDDENIVLYDDILGKYAFRIAGLGRIFSFLRSPLGFFLCIFLPIAAIVVYEVIHFFTVLRKSKEEQEMPSETEQPQVEQPIVRSEYELLLAELQTLQAQMAEIKQALRKPIPVRVYQKKISVRAIYSKSEIKKPKNPPHHSQQNTKGVHIVHKDQ